MPSVERTKNQNLVIDAPIKRVTVLEDRAQIVRSARIELSGGITSLRIDDVAPVIVEKSLCASMEPAGAGFDLVELRVRRRLRRRRESRPEEIAALEGRIEEISSRIDGLADEAARISGHRGLLSWLDGQQLSEIAQDVSWSRIDRTAWARDLSSTRAMIEEVSIKATELAIERQKLMEERTDLQRRRDAVEDPGADMAVSIEAVVSAETSGCCLVKIEYIVPCACWRPRHTAHLLRRSDETVEGTGEGPSSQIVDFKTDACVWQRTGEPWNNVELMLSTQRLSLGAEPPLLLDDELHVRDKPERVVVEARDTRIQTTGLGRDREQSEELPGIDDGGEARLIAARSEAAIQSDGRPHLVNISRFTSKAKVELVSFPEISSAAVLRCEITNESDQPILAGPVDLVMDSGPVGRTMVLFVAPGEKLALGFGPDPGIRIRRVSERKEKEHGMMRRWDRIEHDLIIRVSNIGAESKTLKITERIPVSEIEQVRIQLVEEKTSKAEGPDENGFLVFNLTVARRSTEKLRLRYVVEKHKDVMGLYTG